MRNVWMAVVALTLGGCCGGTRPRYWKATEITSKSVYWTADTADWPIGLAGGPVFLTTDGKLVGLASYELQSVSDVEFEAATRRRAGVGPVWMPNGGYRCGVAEWHVIETRQVQ